MTGPAITQRMRYTNTAYGRALVIDSDIPDNAPEDVREGLARRAIVNGGGVCPCGARIRLNRAQRRAHKRAASVIRVDIEHEANCLAGTEVLGAAVDTWRSGGAA